MAATARRLGGSLAGQSNCAIGALTTRRLRRLFGENLRRIVLLDTLRNPQSRRDLEAFAAVVGLPCRVVGVGLDHFQHTIAQIVRPSRAAGEREEPTVRPKALPDQANYALAFDLLVSAATGRRGGRRCGDSRCPGRLFHAVARERAAYTGVQLSHGICPECSSPAFGKLRG